MTFFSDFTAEEKERVEAVVSDVDDTITSDGLLYPEALEALYSLKKNGKRIILVTGGSAGWADTYIRQWPIDAVIAESGALLLYRKEGVITYLTNPVISEDADFEKKRKTLLSMTRNYVFSSDQYARLYDVAYEKRALSKEREERLFEMIEDLGGTALVSSIHVNVLFSPISKKKGLDAFFPVLSDSLGIKKDIASFYYSSLALGDSTNDEALFSAFSLSVGNKRVYDNIASFRYLPTYITNMYGGSSFSYVISKLLSSCE